MASMSKTYCQTCETPKSHEAGSEKGNMGMTDPRIEAAARAMCEYAHQCEGEPVQWHEIKEASKATARRFALIALEAADAATCIRVAPMPIPVWRIDENAIGMIACAEVGAASPETIAIPEVRNDRPIEV